MMIYYFLPLSPVKSEGVRMRCEEDQAGTRQTYLDEMSPVCGTDVGAAGM